MKEDIKAGAWGAFGVVACFTLLTFAISCTSTKNWKDLVDKYDWEEIQDIFDDDDDDDDPDVPTTTTTTIPPGPQPDPNEDPDLHTPTPDDLHPPIFSTDGCTIVKGRESGFVNNPKASRGVLKIVLPKKYSSRVTRVVVFGDDYQEEIDRAFPNEADGRQRYYGNKNPKNYPKPLWIRWDLNDDGKASSGAVLVKDPEKRVG